MKNIFTAFMLVTGLSLTANAGAIDCETLRDVGGEHYSLRIDDGHGSSWQDALLIARNSNQWTHYTVVNRTFGGFNTVEFWGTGIDLSIDLAFDQEPQQFRTYDSKLRVDTINSGKPFDISCEFAPF